MKMDSKFENAIITQTLMTNKWLTVSSGTTVTRGNFSIPCRTKQESTMKMSEQVAACIPGGKWVFPGKEIWIPTTHHHRHRTEHWPPSTWRVSSRSVGVFPCLCHLRRSEVRSGKQGLQHCTSTIRECRSQGKGAKAFTNLTDGNPIFNMHIENY